MGQAGAPYAKTVPSKTPVLGALPDPGDIYDRKCSGINVTFVSDSDLLGLMARKKETRESKSGLSSMLLYHATIIIHGMLPRFKSCVGA